MQVAYPWEDHSSASAGYLILGIEEFGYFRCFIFVRVLQDSQAGRDGASMYGEGDAGAQVAAGVYIRL